MVVSQHDTDATGQVKDCPCLSRSGTVLWWLWGLVSPRAVRGLAAAHAALRSTQQFSVASLPSGCLTFRTVSPLTSEELTAWGYYENKLRYSQVKPPHSVGTDFDGCLLAPSYKKLRKASHDHLPTLHTSLALQKKASLLGHNQEISLGAWQMPGHRMHFQKLSFERRPLKARCLLFRQNRTHLFKHTFPYQQGSCKQPAHLTPFLDIHDWNKRYR